MSLAGELRRSYGCEDGRIAEILFQTDDIQYGPLMLKKRAVVYRE
jgi:hypothetical protein